jgi:hypothetical protein
MDQEGKGAVRWTRLSCRSFAANGVRLQLHALAYSLGNSCALWRRRSPSKTGRRRASKRSWEGSQPRPLRGLPGGRGRDTPKPVRRHPADDRGIADSTSHVNSVVHSVSCVPSKPEGDVRLDDKKFAVTGLATGRAVTLPSTSATRNDICLLQKAANGKKLSLTEPSIWRISAECIGIVRTMRQALECCHRGWVNRSPLAWPHRVRRFRPARFSTTGSGLEGLGLWRRARTDVPLIVD